MRFDLHVFYTKYNNILWCLWTCPFYSQLLYLELVWQVESMSFEGRLPWLLVLVLSLLEWPWVNSTIHLQSVSSPIKGHCSLEDSCEILEVMYWNIQWAILNRMKGLATYSGLNVSVPQNSITPRIPHPALLSLSPLYTNNFNFREINLLGDWEGEQNALCPCWQTGGGPAEWLWVWYPTNVPVQLSVGVTFSR